MSTIESMMKSDVFRCKSVCLKLHTRKSRHNLIHLWVVQQEMQRQKLNLLQDQN